MSFQMSYKECHQIEMWSFWIDLLLGIGPIAKRPYPMSIDELKELKKQLGNVKKILEKITLTYLLAFSKPEDVLHLKGYSL